MERAKLSSDNFYKRVSSGRSHHGLSQSNFYIPSNKSETYSTLIQILKGDLLSIQDMILLIYMIILHLIEQIK